ncbi:hypothetical protein Bbelb_012350 [Branchiostoma belcheri]|nr:hypothetical protein Bbelb_012350 [Branchiostoma belcheri]
MASIPGLPYVIVLVFISSTALGKPENTSSCTLEMFGNSSNAFWACRTELALQRNWFPDPIAGLFSYQTWNGFDGFWQNGAVLESVVNFMHYANNTRHLSIIQNSFRYLDDLLLAYAPEPSYDDMAWFGLSYARIYEIFGDQNFLSSAKDVFDHNWMRGWDSSGNCTGGMWFDYTKDGVDYNNKTKNCTANKVFGPTYNSGVLIGGLVELYRINNQSSYLSLAHKLANATIANNTKGGIFREYCEDSGGCDDDALMYKGIFVRNLRYLMELSDNSTRAHYNVWIQNNVKAVLSRSRCEPLVEKCNITYKDGPPVHNVTGPLFGTTWAGPYNQSAPMQETCVLDLFTSSIPPGVRCVGQGCTYDPPNPPPIHLTCSSHPCPRGRTAVITALGKQENTSSCTLEMFGNSSNAFWACRTELALQRNWFPDPLASFFSYQTWNGFDGFWQNGAVLETLVNFMHYTNNTRHLSIIQNSFRYLDSLLLAYAPEPLYDDMAWWGLSYARIYEIFGDERFLSIAKDIFDHNWAGGWDSSGFKDKDLLKKVNKQWRFIVQNQLVDPHTYLVSDGVDYNNKTKTAPQTKSLDQLITAAC